MSINIEKQNNKLFIKVALRERKKIEKVKVFNSEDAVKLALKEFDIKDSKKIKLISKPPHDLMNNTTNLIGTWIFELQKEKPVDIPKKSVIIDEPKIEAEHPIFEEPKEEASLFSEPLPYGLKSTVTKTKAKKKKTTKKKKIEE